MKANKNGFEYRALAIKAAKDLGYGKEAIEQIEAAKNDAEIDRIMRSARHKQEREDARRGF